MILTRLQHATYKRLLKPVLFMMDPEFVHRRFIAVGYLLGSNPVTRWILSVFLSYRHPSLEQTICGLRFSNPVGLAGGFDKDAYLMKILPSVGFGWMEIGSVTARHCAGNAGKHLWRLPKSKGIVVHYGLKNNGAAWIAHRLSKKRYAIPLGLNVARTNDEEASASDLAGIRDYIATLSTCPDVGDYVTLNVSCPNSCGGETFLEPHRLDQLLTAVDGLKISKPIFLKIAADLSTTEVDAILEVADRHRVDGFIFSNLTKNYRAAGIVPSELTPEMKGGISGKPVEALSNALIAHVFKQKGTKYVIIGCGGIFSAQDAYGKIRAGASLVQLITGMIFEGPQLIGEINRGLVDLLKKDGFSSLSEAIGADVK